MVLADLNSGLEDGYEKRDRKNEPSGPAGDLEGIGEEASRNGFRRADLTCCGHGRGRQGARKSVAQAREGGGFWECPPVLG